MKARHHDDVRDPVGLFRLGSGRESGQRWRAKGAEKWWSQTESNRRPLACHASALPTELWPLTGKRRSYIRRFRVSSLFFIFLVIESQIVVVIVGVCIDFEVGIIIIVEQDVIVIIIVDAILVEA